MVAAGALALGMGSGAPLAASSGSVTPAPSPASTAAKAQATAPSATVQATGQKTTEAQESQSVRARERATAMRLKAEHHEAATRFGGHEVAADRLGRGVVTHVDTNAKPETLVMNATRFSLAAHPKDVTKFPAHGPDALVVGVDVLPNTQITQGKTPVTLAGVRSGDVIWMEYDRTGNHLRADRIRVLKSAPTMAEAATK
jgi:hypothetical protein